MFDKHSRITLPSVNLLCNAIVDTLSKLASSTILMQVIVAFLLTGLAIYVEIMP